MMTFEFLSKMVIRARVDFTRLACTLESREQHCSIVVGNAGESYLM